MTTIYIHPYGAEEPLLDIVVGMAFYGDGQGTLDILIPTYEESLKRLFENPLMVRGQRIAPWTAEALQYILDSGLYSLGLHGERQ